MLVVESEAMMKYPRFHIRVGIANAHRLNGGTQLDIVSLISHLPLLKGIFRGAYYIYIYITIYIRPFRFLCKALVCHKVPPACQWIQVFADSALWVCIESEGIDFARALRVLDEAFS